MHTQRGLVVLDQLAAHVHGRAVECAGELERRFVFVPNRRAGVGAADDAAGKPNGEWHRERNVTLPDKLAVDVKLGAARRPLP